MGVITAIALFIFFDRKVAAYSPVIFWAISLYGILNYRTNILKLSDSVKKTKHGLFKNYSFGKMLTRRALSDKKFLDELNGDELSLIMYNKIIFKYLMICFVLFAISAIVVVLK